LEEETTQNCMNGSTVSAAYGQCGLAATKAGKSKSLSPCAAIT